MNNKKKNVIIGSILIILIIVIGFLIKKYFFPIEIKPPEEPPEEEPKIILPSILYNLSGAIKKMESNSISFEAELNGLDEKGQLTKRMEVRKAIITPTTKFYHLTFVEIEPGRKTIKESPITFKDLRVGDYIEAVSNQDISHAEEFEATLIRILPK